MDSSFTPIEQMLKFRASRHEDFPYQEILLTRLCMHMQSKLLENRNKMLKAQGINETLFMALITLESQENHSIQPSELSCALGSSRTNATRIADELEKRGWIERRESDNDRRCLHLQLTEKGHEFLREVLPPQHNCLHQLWSALSTTEKRSARANHPQIALPSRPDGTRRCGSRSDELTRHLAQKSRFIKEKMTGQHRNMLAFLASRSAQPMS
ncbi:MarR-family transcriptional repressor [Escherichia coli]|uniref:MarR-family transcriptional repressor n=1 Tax=Escherichia coli TaxID=562 RepID=A0A2X1KBK4_ECOLX|nr:MarR-family transcriptional repressor [Escherichia coli]